MATKPIMMCDWLIFGDMELHSYKIYETNKRLYRPKSIYNPILNSNSNSNSNSTENGLRFIYVNYPEPDQTVNNLNTIIKI